MTDVLLDPDVNRCFNWLAMIIACTVMRKNIGLCSQDIKLLLSLIISQGKVSNVIYLITLKDYNDSNISDAVIIMNADRICYNINI